MTTVVERPKIRNSGSARCDAQAESPCMFEVDFPVAFQLGFSSLPDFESNLDKEWLDDVHDLDTSAHWVPLKTKTPFLQASLIRSD